MSTLRDILDELFIECEHGDIEHRQWLRDKFNDFAIRKENEFRIVTRQTSIGPKTDIYQGGHIIGSSG